MHIALKKLTVTFPANPTIMEGVTEEGSHFRAKYQGGLVKFFLDNEVIFEKSNVVTKEDACSWEEFVQCAKENDILLDVSNVSK